jgi:hypothetical protein
VVLELEGDEDEIKHGISWVVQKGVSVDPVIVDIAKGK